MRPFAFTCYTVAVFLLFTFVFSSSCTKINFEVQPKPPYQSPTPPNLAGHPNIILIVADDIGYEVPAFNGGQSYSTPGLDRLAANGLRFTNCFASPLSSPSRFMLATGKYNFRNYTSWGSMNPSETTIATVLRSAGYATCVSGRWQFDGGDASIRSLGYDKYCVWDAFKNGDEEGEEIGSSYKNPTIYQNGAYLPADSTAGKYGIDIFNRYVTAFIDSNKSRPFFIYYPIPIGHAPFTPTPDDAQFATWSDNRGKSDTLYFRSMVKYMDKAIDSVVAKVKDAGLEKNTVILFVSDNGTPQPITSWYQYKKVTGGMGSTNIYGTHVPMLAYCPGSIPAGVCRSFVGFTDFLPTLAALANTTLPATEGATDGVSFRNQLFEPNREGRTYLYTYYFPHPEYPTTLQRTYVQDTAYKYYNNGYGFYDIVTDPYEQSKINLSTTTEDQQKVIAGFRKVIESIHP